MAEASAEDEGGTVCGVKSRRVSRADSYEGSVHEASVCKPIDPYVISSTPTIDIDY